MRTRQARGTVVITKCSAFVFKKSALNEGRTIYTDNYYTSVSLAHVLLEKKTHLVGTLRSNRKQNPREVTQKKLKKGETVSLESTSGTVIRKWMDKREVLTLSTKHTPEMLKVRHGDKEVEKPTAIVEYNKHKAYIDLSDQMKAYNMCLRRGVKWYRKLAVELLTGSALVNAFISHQEVRNDGHYQKEIVTKSLLNLETQTGDHENDNQHLLEDVGRNNRSRCTRCYGKLAREFRRIHAQQKAQKTKFSCIQWSKHFCMPCFFEIHRCNN